MEKDEEFLASLSKEEYDSFTYMNVVLTKEVFERYKTDIMSALDEPCQLPCIFIITDLSRSSLEINRMGTFSLQRFMWLWV